MQSYSYYNGEFGKTEEIKIPLSDRSIYFADAIYDAAIGKNGRIFQVDEHIHRFLSSAKKIGISHRPTYDEIFNILTDVIARTDIDEFFVYFQLSRDTPSRIHSALSSEKSNLLITVTPISVERNPREIALITMPDVRHLMCDVKTVNLLPAVIASTYAESRGADEAVFHRGDAVTECAHSNISILKGGTLMTHPLTNTILPGITRHHLLIACEKLGIPYRERVFTLDELYSADEILVTSTSKLCRRANRINGIPVGEKDAKAAHLICEFLYKEYYDFCKLP